jgi:hypothetical protein
MGRRHGDQEELESENSQQKLNSTLRMQFSKNALVRHLWS